MSLCHNRKIYSQTLSIVKATELSVYSSKCNDGQTKLIVSNITASMESFKIFTVTESILLFRSLTVVFLCRISGEPWLCFNLHAYCYIEVKKNQYTYLSVSDAATLNSISSLIPKWKSKASVNRAEHCYCHMHLANMLDTYNTTVDTWV